MRTLFYLLLSCALSAQTYTVTLPENLADTPLDGRLLLLLSTDDSAEPRFQITDGPNTQIVIGKDVENWVPGTTVTFTEEDDIYPLDNLSDIKPGPYRAQVLLH
ncbi:MAG: hypothetical protein AAFN92_21100 [Bacteroidota bacterium]